MKIHPPASVPEKEDKIGVNDVEKSQMRKYDLWMPLGFALLLYSVWKLAGSEGFSAYSAISEPLAVAHVATAMFRSPRSWLLAFLGGVLILTTGFIANYNLTQSYAPRIIWDLAALVLCTVVIVLRVRLAKREESHRRI